MVSAPAWRPKTAAVCCRLAANRAASVYPLNPLKTIKESSVFQKISRTGKRWAGSAFIMQVLKTEKGTAFHLGLTASRKVGGAVVRNKAKRRLREVVRLLIKERELAGFDMVLIAKAAATSCDFQILREDLQKGLKATGIL